MTLYQYFMTLYRHHFFIWWRFVVFLCLFLFSHLTFGQSVPRVDSIKPKLTLKSGAQIFSSDEYFNKQIAQVGLEARKIAGKAVDDNEIILVISAQSISLDNNPKIASGVKKKIRKKAPKNFTIVNVLAIAHANSKKYNFKDKPFHSRTFSRGNAERVFINSSSLSKDHSDASIVYSLLYVQRLLSDLHFAIDFPYCSRAYNYGFSFFYSVRPPPVV